MSCDDWCELWKYDVDEHGIGKKKKSTEESLNRERIIAAYQWTGRLEWNKLATYERDLEFIYLFIYFFIYLFIHLFIYLFIHLVIYLFIHLVIYFSIYLVIFLFSSSSLVHLHYCCYYYYYYYGCSKTICMHSVIKRHRAQSVTCAHKRNLKGITI